MKMSLVRARWIRVLLSVVAAGVVIAAWLRMGPLPAGLLDDPARPSTVVVDRHGVALQEALSSEQTRAMRLTADALPPMLVAATVAAEDRRFFRHAGIDPGVDRARAQDESRRGCSRGGRLHDLAAGGKAAAEPSRTWPIARRRGEDARGGPSRCDSSIDSRSANCSRCI
jgi:penicillin-binding protein 1C